MPNEENRTGQSQKTGAGAEAAEGMHGAKGGRSESDNSSVGNASPGRSASDRSQPSGSQPLAGRESDHVSGYGGAAGSPKSPTDTREPAHGDPEEGVTGE